MQAQCWPVALAGRDCVGIAETGSGKTLAFMAPAIAHCYAQPKLASGEGPMVLVLAPTRELAGQIYGVSGAWGKCLGVRCGVVYGGVDRGPQMKACRSGIHILVATPGRLIDFLAKDVTNFRRTSILIVDEVRFLFRFCICLVKSFLGGWSHSHTYTQN